MADLQEDTPKNVSQSPIFLNYTSDSNEVINMIILNVKNTYIGVNVTKLGPWLKKF